MLPLVRDPNDEVKIQVCEVLSGWSGGTERVVEGLCQALAEDDSAWVQSSAALALGRIGTGAARAGPALLRAAQTGEAGVREQAMRALVMIQPPEATEAFTSGLADATAEVRMVASAGWMKAEAVPASAGPALVEALRDPEPQVRANAAHALARLEELPTGAVTALRECAGDPNDGLRLNAALALRQAPSAEAADLMEHLLNDPNVRVRLVAAGAILSVTPTHPHAAEVVLAATDDQSPRVRQAVEELLPLIPKEPAGSDASKGEAPLAPTGM
nr:HEAT repeat domain-containing protein [Frigoriglobus tundricola]